MIIGLTGDIGAGKSTLAEMVAVHNQYVILSFARRFKNAMCELFNWDKDLIDDYEYKQAIDPIFNRMRRELMTDFATGYIRDKVDPMYHTKMVALDTYQQMMDSYFVIYDDVRHPDEVEFIKRLNGILIRITRPDNKYSTIDHVSEDLAKAIKVDCTIRNDRYPKHMYYQLQSLRILPNRLKDHSKVFIDYMNCIDEYKATW